MRILKILTISAMFGALGAAAESFTIGVSLLTQQHPFYIALADAMKQEARTQGVKLDIAIANQDLNKQVSDVEDFISKRVNAIILSPVDSRGVKAAVGKAQKAGIPLITVDIAANGVDVICHVATDNYARFPTRALPRPGSESSSKFCYDLRRQRFSNTSAHARDAHHQSFIIHELFRDRDCILISSTMRSFWYAQ